MWSDKTPVAEAIRTSQWLFPFVEIFHLLSLSILGGIMLLINLRLLGLPLFKEERLSVLAQSTWKLLLGSIGVVIISGYALFSSEAMKDYFNWGFRVKMGSLLLALLFTFTIHRRLVLSNDESRSPRWSRVAAIVSLALWLTVGLGGRSIGYITGYTS
jgi:peptidoglycan/LPS O-acetylase OafA/YrhL